MRRSGWLVLVAITFWPAPGQPAAAASLSLTERERQEAIRAGSRSVVNEDFGAEWKASDGAGQWVTVMTPFHRLALAARNSAFKRQPLKPKEIAAALKESTRGLAVWVTLRGARADFARFFTPALMDGRAEIKPTFVQNERTALRLDDGRYAARCLYVFPAQGLNGKGKLTLVVRNADDKEMAKFTVDLAAMR